MYCYSRRWRPAIKDRSWLGFRFGFEFDVAVGEFDGVFHTLALVLLANLLGLLLDERGEGVNPSGDVLAGLFLSCDQSVVEALNLLALALVDAVKRKRLRSRRGRRCGVADTINVMVLRLQFLFGDAHSLNRQQGILRAAIAFFADARLLAPQIAVHGVTLGNFVVAVALREAHAATVGKLPQQGQHLPLDIGGRPLGRIAEEYLVLDFQAPQLRIEKSQFLVGGHRNLRDQCSEGNVAERGTARALRDMVRK